jgi:hypothetical protein
MIDCQTCIRCLKRIDTFEYDNDAVAFEDELLGEGLEVEFGDVVCDECARELVEREQVSK